VREERDTGTGGRPAFRYHANDRNDIDDQCSYPARPETGDTSLRSSTSSAPEPNGRGTASPPAGGANRRRVRL
jgi:hypothetical protein